MSFNGHLGQARYRPSSIPSTNPGDRGASTDLRSPELAILQQHQYQYYDDRDSMQSFTLTDNLNRIRVEGLNEVDEAVFSYVLIRRFCFPPLNFSVGDSMLVCVSLQVLDSSPTRKYPTFSCTND